MAEAILRRLGEGAIEVESAGTVPASDVHPLARRAVKTLLGVDMDSQYPKAVDRFVGQPFDYVITVCDHAAETCPVFPGAPERIHWSFEDPAAVTGTAEQKQRAFDATATQLLSHIRFLLSLPAVRNRIGQAVNPADHAAGRTRDDMLREHP